MLINGGCQPSKVKAMQFDLPYDLDDRQRSYVNEKK